MTPKLKAIELVDKFLNYVNCWDNNGANYEQAYKYAKECALIAVNEFTSFEMIFANVLCFDDFENEYKTLCQFFNEVKQEIEKL